jgi:hypothetical protein
LFHADLAARECGNLTLGEALDLVVLYAEAEPAKFERAALRWHARFVMVNPTPRTHPRAGALGKNEPLVRACGASRSEVYDARAGQEVSGDQRHYDDSHCDGDHGDG